MHLAWRFMAHYGPICSAVAVDLILVLDKGFLENTRFTWECWS